MILCADIMFRNDAPKQINHLSILNTEHLSKEMIFISHSICHNVLNLLTTVIYFIFLRIHLS